jgi:hypothetical protein
MVREVLSGGLKGPGYSLVGGRGGGGIFISSRSKKTTSCFLVRRHKKRFRKFSRQEIEKGEKEVEDIFGHKVREEKVYFESVKRRSSRYM